MKQIIYKTKGTCSRAIEISLDENNVITSCKYIGGCQGNTTAISILVKGMKAEDAIKKLKGVQCGMKGTSCPDQLACALEQNI